MLNDFEIQKLNTQINRLKAQLIQINAQLEEKNTLLEGKDNLIYQQQLTINDYLEMYEVMLVSGSNAAMRATLLQKQNKKSLLDKLTTLFGFD